jgi:Na+-driven multidrug efflux pump
MYVFWVGLGFFFWGIYLIFAGYIFFLKKNFILAVLAVVNVTLNLGFNYVFINAFGAIGAAYATCLSYFIVALIISIWSNKLYPMPWLHFKSILRRNEKAI